jgi:probable phosphoglycerate mutase
MGIQIYLVRHGKIAWKSEKAYIGQLDVPLSPEGVEQSEKLRAHFETIPLDQTYTSPLSRCVNTLDIILGDCPVPRLRIDAIKEIDMGEWDGKTFSEIKNSCPEIYEQRGRELDIFAPPAGESFIDLQQRVLPAFAEIIKDNHSKSILIVAHAGVIRVILATLFGLSIKEVFNWTIPYAGIFNLCYNQEKDKWICKNQ